MTEVLTPDCPLCGDPPRIVMGMQAFCGNEECTALIWSLDSSLDENLLNSERVELPECP